MGAHAGGVEWFDHPRGGEAGLRFACTMCGNCCSGPEGFVRFTDAEAAAIAAHLGMTVADFLRDLTHDTREGRSLREAPGPAGFDCVFLDRTGVQGRALCRIYPVRPEQCRTWPFWKSNLADERAWRRAARTCPGIGRGPLHSPAHVRLTRDRVDI